MWPSNFAAQQQLSDCSEIVSDLSSLHYVKHLSIIDESVCNLPERLSEAGWQSQLKWLEVFLGWDCFSCLRFTVVDCFFFSN
jgi:hypothetical protein